MTISIEEFNPGPSDHNVLCVDVCGTLYNQNTTADFVKFHHDIVGNRLRKFFLNLISGERNPLVYAMVLIGKVIKKDIHRDLSIFSLKGEARSSLQNSSRLYVLHLKKYEIRPIHSFVERMRKEGWKPILVSNSLDIVIEAIAEQMSVDMVASKLSWSNHWCTGHIATDLTGEKRRHVELLLGLSLSAINCAVVTDNRSDSDLIAVSTAAWLVAKKSCRKWMAAYPEADIVII
ncbi:haloacid dehalogenase-like hydrolase [Alloalcanivorax venustensis]|uniref:haloacid dehalogenase-like hydrolase n=1 Tax=Alloalcanivorax venustensis TaxID=172371 RepID=UPI001891CDC4|nr:haloacid dehalogenase-like hydrolase [Alloalcanivorax venustensis]